MSRFYRKCQGAIDPLDSYLTPFARQKRLGHHWDDPSFSTAKSSVVSKRDV